MLDADMEEITVLEVQGGRATVQLPNTSVEEWSVASLSGEVLPGDRVSVRVDEGDLDVVLLPRLVGLSAERVLYRLSGRPAVMEGAGRVPMLAV